MLAVAGDSTCDALAVAVILSLSGGLATRELGGVIDQRGQAQPACLQQWMELITPALLRWAEERRAVWGCIIPRTRTRKAVVAGANRARIELPERNFSQGYEEADRHVRRWMLDPNRKRPHVPFGGAGADRLRLPRQPR